MEDRSGKKANKTGKQLEAVIRNRLVAEGYRKVPKKKFKLEKKENRPIFTEQEEICKSIYGTGIKCDFLLYHPDKHPECLVIEAKWQQVGGSVDEKYPYLVLNIKEQYAYPTWIILDGEGYKTGAEKWLRAQAGKECNLKTVLSMLEFHKAANDGKL